MDNSFKMRSAGKRTGAAFRQATAHDTQINQAPMIVAVDELVQLNLRYLNLPTVESTLFTVAGQRFSSLSNDARLAVADCLFSLFTIGLNRPRLWLPLLTGVGEPESLTVTPRRSDETEFVATVLFFAWHMARADASAAKILLDLDGEVASALRGVSLACLLPVAGSVHWLEPRWQTNRHFWPALLRNSSNPTGPGLRAVKLLGRQLLAAESLSLPKESRCENGPKCSLDARRESRVY